MQTLLGDTEARRRKRIASPAQLLLTVLTCGVSHSIPTTLGERCENGLRFRNGQVGAKSPENPQLK